MDCYFGTYQTFETESKKDAAVLIGADNLVGDIFDLDIEYHDQEHRAWIVNKFGKRVGYFPSEFSRTLSVFQARNFVTKAILSFVAFTDRPEPGFYWGEMAVICYDPSRSAPFETFTHAVQKSVKDGARPDISLSDDGIGQVVASNGSWLPKKTVPLPPKERGTVIMKSRQSISERLIEQGRSGNKGCYVVSWLFLLALVALVIFGLKSCGVF